MLRAFLVKEQDFIHDGFALAVPFFDLVRF